MKAGQATLLVRLIRPLAALVITTTHHQSTNVWDIGQEACLPLLATIRDHTEADPQYQKESTVAIIVSRTGMTTTTTIIIIPTTIPIIIITGTIPHPTGAATIGATVVEVMTEEAT